MHLKMISPDWTSQGNQSKLNRVVHHSMITFWT
jgi:hypothetical protein